MRTACVRVHPLLLGVLLAVSALEGCGFSGTANPAPAVAINGTVQGGRQPVSGASLQLYAAGTSGKASAAQPLLSAKVKTDGSGTFKIPAGYPCPSASSQIFIVARGGNPGLTSASTNPNLQLTAMLGPCSGLASIGTISINEVTTVGSVWPLAAFMSSSTDLGSAAADTAFPAAVASIPEYIDIAQGISPGTPTPTTYFAENSKLYSLADLLASCVNSAGGAAGDGSPCGHLFSDATPPGGAAPTNTIDAAMRIAQNPNQNVVAIFGLASGVTAFLPGLTTAPADWMLDLSYIVAAPSISLATGSYTGSQEVSISDATNGSTIYYTTDGTAPTSSSAVYTGAFSISVSSTVEAVAILNGSQSSVTVSALTIIAPRSPVKLAFLQQPSNAVVGQPLSPAVQVAVEDSNGDPVTAASAPVTLTLVSSAASGGSTSWTAISQNGIATFNNITINIAGNGYTLLATAANLASATSSPFTVSAATGGAPSAAKLAFLQQPSAATTGVLMAPTVEVVVEDASGNALPTATNPVTVSLIGGTGLSGTLTVIPQNGIAAFGDLSVGVPGAGLTLSAMSPGLASATSIAFSVTSPVGPAPSPVKLAFLVEPSNALAAATISPAVEVSVEDTNGNVVTAATNPITLTLLGGTGLGGTLTASPVNGVATFSNLSVSNAGSGYTLSATSAGLTAAASTAFAITTPGNGPTAQPVKLGFLQQPSNALTGATISPAVQVVVEDASGNTVTVANNPITLALTSGSGLAGTLTANAQNGIATFDNLSVNVTGTGLTLSATSTGLTAATSSVFTISAPSGPPAPSPVKLAFLQQPTNTVAGAAITPAVRVVIEDGSGNVLPSSTNPVTIALSSGSGLAGTLTVAPQNGIATFSNLTAGIAGAGYSLVATTPGLTSATSTTFNITAPGGGPATPVKLAFLQQPSNTAMQAVISPAVEVVIEDVNGNPVSSATSPITIALSSGSGLAGTLTIAPQSGIATFTDLSVSVAGTYTLSATSSGLTPATSTAFTISPTSPAPPAKLAFVQQPSNVTAGSSISPAVTVAVEDSSGNTTATATNPVTIALTLGSGLGGTLTATPLNGIATFSNLSVTAAGTYALTATSPGLASTTSSVFTVSAVAPTGTTYYLSATGNDANNGLSPSAPWLSPNHALNCGDVISAAPGNNYSSNNFYTGKWGTVSCPAGNNVAWLRCATFDTCKISTTVNQGFWVDKSYWGVEGWEVTTAATDTNGTCFLAGPATASIHHVIFADNVANGCSQSGFSSINRGSAGVDYFTVVGNIAFNAAQGSAYCTSGISIYQPVQTDSVAGTHIYVAGNFAYGNLEPRMCAGTSPTDGEGIIFDTFDGSQGGLPQPYAAQAVAENNILVGNGGRGVEVLNNSSGSSHSAIYIKNNTSWGNLTDPNQHWLGCGEIQITTVSDVQATGNLVSTDSATGCGGNPIYAFAISTGNGTDSIDSNFAYGYNGDTEFKFDSGAFAYGSHNNVGSSPQFTNATTPGAPVCSGATNVPGCMAGMIADFIPQNAAAQGFGYQEPSATPDSNPVFPAWLCTANVPSGLVTMGCKQGP